MCGYFLCNDDGVYVKSLDTANHKLEFTNDINEANNYTGGTWFAETALDFLKFHFKEHKDVLNTMKCKYVDD